MCDNRGKISTGMKSPKGFPMSTDYFVCDAFKEITGLYGEKPSKLIIYMPSDDLYDFFDCNFQQYRSDHQKVRQCDGEFCRHILDETVNIKPKEGETELRVKSFEQGQVTACICNFMPETVPNPKKNNEPMKNPQLCSYGMSLKAFVANPVTLRPMSPQPIMFRSGSKNTGDTIFTELKRYPRFRGIPFELEVSIVRVGQNKFPVWKIRPYIEIESMIAYQLEAAPIDTGLRALPPPLAPVEDGQFNNEGNYQVDELGKNQQMKEILSGEVEGGVPNETFPPPGREQGKAAAGDKSPSQSDNVQDAEYTEIPPAGSKSGVKEANNADVLIECIESFESVQKLNQWWIKEDLKSKVAVMSSVDRERVFEARDRRKAEINNNL